MKWVSDASWVGCELGGSEMGFEWDGSRMGWKLDGMV